MDTYQNKSQHRKLTLENLFLPPLLQGFETATFQSRVRRSYHWAIPAPYNRQPTHLRDGTLASVRVAQRARQTQSTGLRHPSFGGRCRKTMLGVWQLAVLVLSGCCSFGYCSNYGRYRSLFKRLGLFGYRSMAVANRRCMIGLNGPLQVSPTTMNSIFRVHFSRFLFKVDLGRHEQSSRQNVWTPEIACDLIFVLVVDSSTSRLIRLPWAEY